MLLKKINQTLLICSLIFIIITIFLKISIYFHTILPKIENIKNISIIGFNNEKISLALDIEMKNHSLFPFEIDNYNLFLYDNELQISRLNNTIQNIGFSKIFLSPHKIKNVKFNTFIDQDIFKKYINSPQYSDQIIIKGQIHYTVFKIKKSVDIEQVIEINKTKLISQYLKKSIKMVFLNNNVTLSNKSIYQDYKLITPNLELPILIYNHTGVDLTFEKINAYIFINRILSGQTSDFSRFNSLTNNTSNSISLKFTLDKLPLNDFNILEEIESSSEKVSYLIEGKAKIQLWNNNYEIPIEIFK
ncbi:MAG: hypothetical protein PHY08_02975 [Candidatus Cloacimonetes bacterium]|nr:hypothetical protein [Candidatus Cloacimonadota bacterium]